VAALSPSEDRPRPAGGLAGLAFAVQLDHHAGTQHGVLLLAADPLEPSVGDRSRVGRAPGFEGHKHRVKGGVAGCPLRWRAAMARWRMASGLRSGMPRPWRMKALRSDG
jgi:hypothetical protein